jgi:adenylate kinase
MRLVLLGAPGSGKGTQGELLVRKYGVPRISTGDILRAEIAGGTPLGLRAKEAVSNGTLVTDDVMLGMVESRLLEPDVAQGFILDGFPRSIPQAEGLDSMLGSRRIGLDAVVKIDVAKKLILERMTGRRICSGCGTVYSLAFQPPKVAGRCDLCGSDVVQREDDTEETVRRRLNVYEAATAPLIDYYDARGLLVIVHGEHDVQTVFESIVQHLGTRASHGR